jgi:bifunctional non-homologous end joining protein LigD
VEREIWKNIPKAKLITYYHAVSKYILPHLRNRPLSLHIKPAGAMAPGFYIKDMEGRQPECADIFSDQRRHPKQGKRNEIDYLVCNNLATLIYTINLGCVDMNPWMSRKDDPQHPDFLNIDLDPSEDNFSKAIETAKAAKELLRMFKLTAFVKTSGKTGIHIYIPVAGFSFGEARRYSEWLGRKIHELVPSITTTNVSISSRGDRLFIDPSQNDYADTLAAAYSVRPHRIPSVSTPLDWKEVRPGLDPALFTIDTIPKRLEKKGDLFIDVMDEKIRAKNSRLLRKIVI